MKLYGLANAVLLLLAGPAHALWPAPQEMERGQGFVRLAEDFDIILAGPALLENVLHLGDVSSAFRTSLRRVAAANDHLSS
jgi:hypothetical protein